MSFVSKVPKSESRYSIQVHYLVVIGAWPLHSPSQLGEITTVKYSGQDWVFWTGNILPNIKE